MNLLWIAAITILVCALMVKGNWVRTGSVLHQAPNNLWAVLGWWVLLQVIVQRRLFVKHLTLLTILGMNHEVIFKSFCTAGAMSSGLVVGAKRSWTFPD